MDADEIRQKFQATVDEVVSGAKAKLDPQVSGIVSQLTREAARQVAGLDEWQQEHDFDVGVAEYKKLAEKLVKAARTLRMFPDVNKHGWDLALMELGPNPPFYFP